jgi:hypothetical protein
MGMSLKFNKSLEKSRLFKTLFIMKKYLVLLPFSLSEKYLIMIDDIIFAESVRQMTHIYSSKTKRYVGKVSTKIFVDLVMEIPI